jgi:hypothetical protein
MELHELNTILKYKKDNNIKLKEVAKYFGIGVRRLRKVLKENNISIPKKIVKPSDETINKRKISFFKNSPISKYDWGHEYKMFIESNKEDNSIGIKSFCKNRGYHDRYLRGYINENNLKKPRGIPKRTQNWKDNISKSKVGKVSNPNGSNGKLKGQSLKKSHREKIRESLVKSHYNISINDWFKIKGDKEIYYREVWRITYQQPLSTLENYDKRGNAGNIGAYQIDHIYPISKGFIEGINPEIIGNIKNIQMLPWYENIRKSNSV